MQKTNYKDVLSKYILYKSTKNREQISFIIKIILTFAAVIKTNVYSCRLKNNRP